MTKEQRDAAFAAHERDQRLDEWRTTTPAERVRIAGEMIQAFLPQLNRWRERAASPPSSPNRAAEFERATPQ